MIYLRLFYEFFKTGLFAIGGGMATVPFLQNIAAKTGWYSAGELADMIAVSESTPGPMGVNMSTYVGYKVGVAQYGVGGGILGSLISTLGLITPSIIVILIIAAFLNKFRENRYVEAALYGLRPASVGLISAAGLEIILFSLLQVDGIFNIANAKIDISALVLAAVILVLTRWVKFTKKLHPIVMIALSAAAGIVFGMGV